MCKSTEKTSKPGTRVTSAAERREAQGYFHSELDSAQLNRPGSSVHGAGWGGIEGGREGGGDQQFCADFRPEC